MKKHYLLFFLFTAFFAKAQEPFVTTWEVTADDLTITTPVYTGWLVEFVDYTVDFGDGTVLTNQSNTVSHTYSSPGTYTMTLSGIFSRIEITYQDRHNIKSVEQWGDIQWTSMYRAFHECPYVVINATDAPDLSQVTELTEMFMNASSMNQSINHWDVSNVTNMDRLFQGASVFNQPLDDWDVSNVTHMRSLFQDAAAFNQPLDDWDVSAVTDMRGLFNAANSFNQPLNNWDVSSVTSMQNMFNSADEFNQPLNNWDVSNCTNMAHMFYAAYIFDQNIDSWDVSNVTLMNNMFNWAESFNQPLNSWDVSAVTNMANMFNNAILFNQPLDAWDVSSVTTMSEMFYKAESFNQPLNSWNVSNVTNMYAMFTRASAFNQNLNDWNTGNVTDMSNMFSNAAAFNGEVDSWNVSNINTMNYMFLHAYAFNQPLNDWDVSNVQGFAGMFTDAVSFNQPLHNWDISSSASIYNMFYNAYAFNQDISMWDFGNFNLSNFLSNSGLDSDNYDALLQKFVEVGVEDKSLGADGLEYCDSAVRDHLVNEMGWTIEGDSLSDDCLNNDLVGVITLDEDNNGCTSDDVHISSFLVTANNGDFVYSASASEGTYTLGLLEGTYTIGLLNVPDYLSVTPVTSEITLEGAGNEETLNFCLTANETIADLNITMLPLGEARPGFPAEYQLVVQNMGTQTVDNATVTLNFDDALLSFLEANPEPASSITNQLTFEIEDLQPLESNMIDIAMEVFAPPVVNGGEIANFTALVTDQDDSTPADNTFTLGQEVVNSYDPNDKRVLQGEWIYEEQTDEYLNYIIRFQNTGTASAITVRIEDILHENLDWATLMPVSASHNYRVQITDGNHVEFIFDNINLPHEEADETGSNGFIAYKIKPITGIQVGDVMSGNASIFFDFNLPIITNTVTTEVIEPMEAGGTQNNVSCNGQNDGSVSVGVEGGWGDYSYSWSPAGGNAATATGLSAGEYTVTVTDGTGDSIMVDFTITQPGAITITAQPEDDTAVAGSNAEFEVEASNVEEYQWQVSTNGTDWADIANGGTSPAYSGADTAELSIADVPVGHDGYLYRVVLVNGADCSTYSSGAELSVTEIVTNTILAVNDDFSEQTILEGTGGFAGDVTANDLFNGEAVNDLIITVALTDEGGLTGVTIDSDGNLTVPAAAQDGTYTVGYTICEGGNATNCSTATAVVVVSAVSGIEDHRLTDVTLYPNPASDKLYLQTANGIQVQGVAIYNMQGRKMLSFTGHSESFDVSSLSAGVYMVEIKTDKGDAQYKLVKN